jgi:hypothetical protein
MTLPTSDESLPVRKTASRGAMNHYKVGIWIDHEKAVIVSASADRVIAKTLESTDKLIDPQIVAKVKEHYTSIADDWQRPA